MTEEIEMDGVREYGEGRPVKLDQTEGLNDAPPGRWIVRAFNEAGHNCTEIDVLDLVQWLRKNRPDLLEAALP